MEHMSLLDLPSSLTHHLEIKVLQGKKILCHVTDPLVAELALIYLEWRKFLGDRSPLLYYSTYVASMMLQDSWFPYQKLKKQKGKLLLEEGEDM